MDIIVEAVIDAVTVYPDRARVTCHGECQLKAGSHRLLFEELPLSLDPDSVRVAGKGGARVRLLGVDVQRRFYEETPAKNVRELELQVEELEDALRVLEDERAGWSAQAEYVAGMRRATNEYARGLARGRTGVEDQLKLVEFMQAQESSVRAALRDLEVKQRELKRRLEKLQRELNELRSARPRQRYQAQVEIEALAEGDFQTALSYVVSQAGWKPLYDVRLTSGDEEAVLAVSYIAQITQKSGQKWQGVRLTVSTARPALSQRLPEIEPWYLDVYRPPQRKQGRAMVTASAAPAQARLDESFAIMDSGIPEMEATPAPIAAEVALATVQESGAGLSFAVPGRSDIPSDGSPHKTTVNQFSLEPRLDYLAVPKHTDAVFRRATVNNDSPTPLMAGEASLFVADEFIGRTHLDYTPAAGEIELLLGVEERITIERTLKRRDVDKRLMRDKRQLRYGYEIELKNLLPGVVEVEVHDQVPVSRHEDIRVKLDQATPEPADRSDLNLLEWKLTIPAESEQCIAYEYTIEHPRSLQVTGLMD